MVDGLISKSADAVQCKEERRKRLEGAGGNLQGHTGSCVSSNIYWESE